MIASALSRHPDGVPSERVGDYPSNWIGGEIPVYGRLSRNLSARPARHNGLAELLVPKWLNLFTNLLWAVSASLDSAEIGI